LSKRGDAGLATLLAKLQPLSLIALLATLVLLFGFQGKQILAQPARRIASPHRRR
jgi:ACR3 family arsenite transporter